MQKEALQKIFMHKFDYSFLEDGLLPSNYLNATNSISSLRNMSDARKNNYITVFTELESVAKVQSVKSSNEIEGIVTSDERIAEIVKQNSAPLNHNEAEIAGYRDALNIIHKNYETISFSENTILSLHKTLMSHTDYSFGGQYKTSDNVILEIDSYGNRNVRFRPVPAAETKKAMEQMELAYMDALSSGATSELILIPCVILDFLCIHPFRDGNGRMSRLLTLLLLYKSGFDVGKYISFEQQINIDKKMYYDTLKQSSEKWHESENNYFPFVTNFLGTLYKCYSELDKRFAVINSKKINKTNRIEATVLNSLVPISKSEICNILPDVSPTTVEYVLGSLVKSGAIATVGAGRNTKYIRNAKV